jgi:hypothetical protein
MSSAYGPNCGKRVIGHLRNEREITDIQVFFWGVIGPCVEWSKPSAENQVN